MLHDPVQLQLGQLGVSSYGLYADQQPGSAGAGPKGLQLDWPLQPQPVNAAQGHLNSAAAKLTSAATRYTNAVNATSYSKRAAALAADAAASATSVNSSVDVSSPQEGRRSNLSRRSAQSSAQSFDTATSQTDPFAPSPRLALDSSPGSSRTLHQGSSAAQPGTSTGDYMSPTQRGQLQPSLSKKAQSPGGAGPTRRALFPANVNDWSISASRNLDAPEMGSPPESDDEESSSGSSEVSTSFQALVMKVRAMQHVCRTLFNLSRY